MRSGLETGVDVEAHGAGRLALADLEGDLPHLEVPLQRRVVVAEHVDRAGVGVPHLVDLLPDADAEPEREAQEAGAQQHRPPGQVVVGREDAGDELGVGEGVVPDQVAGDGPGRPGVVGRQRRPGRLGRQLGVVVVEVPAVGLGVVVGLLQVEVEARLAQRLQPVLVPPPVGAAGDGALGPVGHASGWRRSSDSSSDWRSVSTSTSPIVSPPHAWATRLQKNVHMACWAALATPAVS